MRKDIPLHQYPKDVQIATPETKPRKEAKHGHSIDAQTIGKRLRTLRGPRTQKEVGDAIGVTAMAISFYERGERVPADDIKVALARYFNSTVEAIFFTF